jgi:PEP-CTERM motif
VRRKRRRRAIARRRTSVIPKVGSNPSARLRGSEIAHRYYAEANINYDSYSTPDNAGFNIATTTADGATDTPYSYYTGPVVSSLDGGGSLTVYCVDLNHFLAGSGMYTTGILDHNGEGQTITEFDSNRIGHIAAIGAAALGINDTAHQDLAAAAQAAIWDIAYDMDNPHSVTGDMAFSKDLSDLLFDPFANVGYATALLVPAGVDNQEMVTGFAASAPEPSTWAMMLLGFAGLGYAGFRRTRQPVAVSL